MTNKIQKSVACGVGIFQEGNMGYQILDSTAMILGIVFIVLISTLFSGSITYYLAKQVRNRHMEAKLPSYIKEELQRKDEIIREKNATIRELNDKWQAEKARNTAALLESQRVVRVLTQDYPEFL